MRGMDLEEVLLTHPEILPCEALAEIARHTDPEEVAAVWAEFVADMGERDIYDGADVLAWLGY